MQGNGGRDPLVDIALLRTCRIVYREASGSPLRLTTMHNCSGSLNRLRHRISKLTALSALDLNKVAVHAHGLYDLFSRLRWISSLNRIPTIWPHAAMLLLKTQAAGIWRYNAASTGLVFHRQCSFFVWN
jgi:hypothetical protein